MPNVHNEGRAPLVRASLSIVRLERIFSQAKALVGQATGRWFPKFDAIPLWVHDPAELAEL
jgi:uncharacterized protein YbaR (Trm112 family)